MAVIDEEVRIEDELEILPPFLQNRANSFPCFLGEFRPEKKRIQGGSLHRSCSRDVIFLTSLTPSNLEFWNSKYGKYLRRGRAVTPVGRFGQVDK